MSFISTLRVFLVDVVSITKASCAQSMDYYDSMMLVLVGMKVVLILLLLAPAAWNKLLSGHCRLASVWRNRLVRNQVRYRSTRRGFCSNGAWVL